MFRKVMLGTAWFTGCLILFANPVGLWPLVIYLTVFGIHIRVTDEGYEAARLLREMKSWSM